MTLRPNDYDKNGDIIPDSVREDKGDLISREALKKALKSNCDLCHDKNTNWCEHCCPLNDFEDLIDNAPTVEAFTEEYVSGAYNEGYMCGSREAEKARPQGEWLRVNNKSNTGCWYKCDKCGCEEVMTTPFCQFCGAEMRKKEGDNK